MRTTPLERTLIEMLTVYQKLVLQIRKKQPSLSLTSILKDDIYQIIIACEELKQERKIFKYFLEWSPHTLNVFYINFEMDVMFFSKELRRERFYLYNFEDNAHSILLPEKWDRKYKDLRTYLKKYYDVIEGIILIKIHKKV